MPSNQRKSALQALVGHIVRYQPLLVEQEMQRVIDLERERCDRGGPQFSVVEFKQRSRPLERAPRSKLRRHICERIRNIDKLGTINGSLILLLPNTEYAGAVKLVNDLCASYDNAADLRWFISTYPTETRIDDGQGQRPEHRSQSARSSHLHTIAAAARQGDDALVQHAIQPLHRFLAQAAPVWKRAVDIIGAFVLLLILSPLLLFCVAYLQLRDPGPILFRQQRIGYLGKPFWMLKLRTMKSGAEQVSHQEHLRRLMQTNAPLTKLDQSGDQRLIPGATLIRRLGIDELAQLLNVIRGEMSLVGPRPCLPYEAAGFDAWHCARFNSLPGLTGLWQVSGKNHTTFREMLALDVRYTKAVAMQNDLRILLSTIPAVIAYYLAESRQSVGEQSRSES